MPGRGALRGINREVGNQTYQRVHVQGTRNVVNAAKRAGVAQVALVSFIRARPTCGAGYHESKFAAEEIVRGCGLDYTVLKAGVIYGKGDHMLDHLSHAFYTFSVFGLVGFKDAPVRPTAVEELAHILKASLVDGRLPRETVCVVGPEEMPLPEAVRWVARVAGKKPWMDGADAALVPLPAGMDNRAADDGSNGLDRADQDAVRRTGRAPPAHANGAGRPGAEDPVHG